MSINFTIYVIKYISYKSINSIAKIECDIGNDNFFVLFDVSYIIFIAFDFLSY